MLISALWRRLDMPGRDAAQISRTEDGWRLDGATVFAHELGPACLSYWVDCAPDWRTRAGGVMGWIAEQPCEVQVTRSEAGGWRLNGEAIAGLDGCLDLDYGFTPATNFLQLQRCALAIGDTVSFPVAWLDVPGASLVELPQRYERRTDRTYWYESPRGAYSALLELADSGFVRTYPGLWAMED